jgi:dihydroxy-acid dehydratase
LIAIDAKNNTINLKVSEQELEKRKAAWKQPSLKSSKGVLFKYAQCVSSASLGCVTDK